MPSVWIVPNAEASMLFTVESVVDHVPAITERLVVLHWAIAQQRTKISVQSCCKGMVSMVSMVRGFSK